MFEFFKNIYSKYISVTANDSIDCNKSDRIRLHKFFIPGGVLKPSKNTDTPIYEDAFDEIEEFLFETLHDEWKNMTNMENSLFNQIELSKIERTLTFKSKKIEELLQLGLIKLVS